MKINIKATGIELTGAIRDYVSKRVSALSKFIRGDATAHVEVGKSTKHHKSGEVFRAEVHLSGAGVDTYAASEEADLYAAIDNVKDEVATGLVREKGRKEALYRRGARRIKDMVKGLNPFNFRRRR